jgi:hypothetical protein
MKFLKKLFSGLSGGTSGDTFSFYLECAKCREKIEVRINRRTDLANEYRETGESGPAYILRKEVLGNNCPNIIEVSMEFDRGRKITSRDVRGGKFVQDENTH